MDEKQLTDELRTLLKMRLVAIQERDARVPDYEKALGAFQEASAVVNDLNDRIDKYFAELRALMEVL